MLAFIDNVFMSDLANIDGIAEEAVKRPASEGFATSRSAFLCDPAFANDAFFEEALILPPPVLGSFFMR